MKELIAGNQVTVDRLSGLLKQAKTVTQYRRIQCVLLRIKLGCSAEEIAQLLGLATTTVHVMHSNWARQGDAFFEVRPRGGRHHQNLDCEQERQLLAPFIAGAQRGDMLSVQQLHRAYEQCADKPVSRMSVYRLLHRHGWRKVAPRPRHPKADLAAQGAFKKTASTGAPGGWTPSQARLPRAADV